MDLVGAVGEGAFLWFGVADLREYDGGEGRGLAAGRRGMFGQDGGIVRDTGAVFLVSK